MILDEMLRLSRWNVFNAPAIQRSSPAIRRISGEIHLQLMDIESLGADSGTSSSNLSLGELRNLLVVKLFQY
jgi:hypothetical protein